MRVELKGQGIPIPLDALPIPSEDGDLPVQTLILPPGDFLKQDYVGLGYTHYEVICIGAVGGRGGDVIGGHEFARSYGGGGGGGGLHRVNGLLADLPDICPVVVGQAGADGIDAANTWPDDDFISTVPPNPPPPWPGGEFYPPYWPAEPGQDGGASSFNNALCRASGGKGGRPAYIYRSIGQGNDMSPPNTSYPGGDGGDGGIGDSLIAGGGGEGGKSILNYNSGSYIQGGSTVVLPEDGTWDGVIGKGGGGGRGGTNRPGAFLPNTSGYAITPQLETSSSGGQGSFNFGDTSFYGPRQTRSSDPFYAKTIVPGAGGGAKLSSLQVYGGRSPGANPNGVVLIRISRIV